jgi:predicted metalloprotease
MGPLGIGGGLVMLILSLIFGPQVFDQGGGSPTDMVQGGEVGLSPEDSAREEPMVQFVSFVLDDAQETWANAFRGAGADFRPARLVLFRDGTQSGCGGAQSAMGPFYCPLDEKVYIDLRFYETMRSRMGAPGDFAQAYVIAHEVGHHVQRVMGITDKVESMRSRMSPTQGNALSVRLELQADCFAGVWAHDAQAARQVLEQGDVEEALNAASQIGDDMLQRRSQGTIVPESFTHGTSAQRVTWFKRGLQTGSINQCNTFEAREL